jgi:hypothetical protein
MRKNTQQFPYVLSAAITVLRRYSDFTANADKRDGPSFQGGPLSFVGLFFAAATRATRATSGAFRGAICHPVANR